MRSSPLNLLHAPATFAPHCADLEHLDLGFVTFHDDSDLFQTRPFGLRVHEEDDAGLDREPDYVDEVVFPFDVLGVKSSEFGVWESRGLSLFYGMVDEKGRGTCGKDRGEMA